jgi:hypothetical protein
MDTLDRNGSPTDVDSIFPQSHSNPATISSLKSICGKHAEFRVRIDEGRKSERIFHAGKAKKKSPSFCAYCGSLTSSIQMNRRDRVNIMQKASHVRRNLRGSTA